MSYDDSWPTDKDYVRWLIGDTDTSNEALSDNEINGLLDKVSSPELAAAGAARSIAAQAAKEPDFAFGTFEMSQGEVVDHYQSLAKQLEENARGGTGVGAPTLLEDMSGDKEEYFSKGMHDYTEPPDPNKESN